MADAIDIEVEKLRIAFVGGYYPAAIEAFRWCVLNDRVLPDWIADVAHGAMIFTAIRGGRNGKGKTGGFFPQARRAEIDEARWNAAERGLAMRHTLPKFGNFDATRDGAFEFASHELAGTVAQGSADAIKRSHRLVQRRKRVR